MKFSHSIAYIISILITISTLIQCTEKISPSFVNASCNGGQYKVKVRNRSNFKVSNPLPWVSYSIGQQMVTIIVEPNTNSERQGAILIDKVSLKVNQSGGNNISVPISVSSSPSRLKYNEVGSISLSVMGLSATNIWWTIGSCEGRRIGFGNPLVTYAPISTTTYYAHWQSDGGSTTCVNVTVLVTGAL